MNNKILIIGDGLLATEIKKQTNWDNISRNKDNIDFDDITSYSHLLKDYDIIFNCVAYTNTYSSDKFKHWNTNFKGVCDLVDFCNSSNKKLIHVSTDYIYTYSNSDATEDDVPVHCKTWYGYTKLLSDGYVQLRCKNHLIFRTSFKKRPCEWERATTIQRGNFDYVDVIAGLMIKLIENDSVGIYNVGTNTKSIYELAKITKPEIIPVDMKINENMPIDVSMNIQKMNDSLNI